MVSGLLGQIGDIIEEVISWITSSLTSVASMFYTTSGTAPNITYEFTFLGVLLLVGFGIGLVWTLINFIRGLVRRG